ncbi:MAG TPA: arginine--tRNA ligase [Gemmatales bacterium]|nr:arginine--tRNA ligase [Gemmatales bacterium]
MNLQTLLQARFHAATALLTGESSVRADSIKPTKDPRFGDYQANGAMALAKQLGKKPQEVAKELIANLDLTGLDTPEVAGPGFINIRLATPWLAERVTEVAHDDRLGVPLTAKSLNYVIDYSSPNVAKPMHVGHLRSTIIGDSLTRLLRFLGHHVVTDNHLGDWGTQFGILIYGFKHFLNQAALDKDPVAEMLRIYIHVRNLIKEEGGDDEEDTGGKNIAEACRLETAKLHKGDPENVALWKRMMPWCQEELDRVYRKLGILPYDVILGESYYNPVLHEVMADLKAKGISEESRGAQVVFHGENQPPSLVQKGDGAYTYTTTDLATIRHRVTAFKANVCLYVVDFRQSLHFQQLFSIARRWGYTEVDLIHISFGSVLGPDGKPIKTREGGAIELGSLLDEAVVRARKIVDENSGELPEAERQKIAEVVGIGAVKYADLCQNRSSDYLFSWEKMLAMQGNTGAYMQYAYARIRSIFRKVGVTAESIRQTAPAISLKEPQERTLALAVLRFPEALDAALAEYKPSAITQYLWDLANAFSSFFEKCHVARAETKELQQSRLLLCDLTARILQKGLDLLGIQTIEQM